MHGVVYPTTPSYGSAVGVQALSSSEAMVGYKDGTVTVWSATDGDALEEVGSVVIPPGIRSFTACAVSTTPTGYMGVFAASHGGEGGMSMGRVDVEVGGARGVQGRVTLASTAPVPGGSASCVHFDAPSQRLVYGTAGGVVGVRPLGGGPVTVMTLGNSSHKDEVPPGSHHLKGFPQQGPHCHSVSCWSYAPNIVIASGGSMVHLLDFSREANSGVRGTGQKFSTQDGSTVLCTAFHGEDPWPIYAGTDRGCVVAWDMRRTDEPCDVLRGVHSGPIHSLMCMGGGGGGAGGGGTSLFSAGDDGTLKRTPLESGMGSGSSSSSSSSSSGSSSSGMLEGSGASLGVGGIASRLPMQSQTGVVGVVLTSDSPLTGAAKLVSRKQRQAGRGEGFYVASSSSGAVEFAIR